MKNHEAHLEIQHIECHLRNVVRPEQHEAAGSDGDRPLHIRVMRIIGYLQDQIGSVSVVEGEASGSVGQERSAKEHTLKLAPVVEDGAVETLIAHTFPKVMQAIQGARDRHWEALSALGEQRDGKVAKWTGDASDAFRDAVYGAVQSTAWIALRSRKEGE